MRLLADQDVYRSTVSFLSAEGHDVVRAQDVGLPRSSDAELLEFARRERRLLVTRDRDFGTLVFAESVGGGVLLYESFHRLKNAVHLERARVLSIYTEAALLEAFVVVEPGRHRLRRITA